MYRRLLVTGQLMDRRQLMHTTSVVGGFGNGCERVRMCISARDHPIPTHDITITIRLCDDCPRLWDGYPALPLSRHATGLQECTRLIDYATPDRRLPPAAAHPYYMYDCRSDGRGDVSCPGRTPSADGDMFLPLRLYKNNKNYNYIIINMIADSHR
jgi:hypothetical protein